MFDWLSNEVSQGSITYLIVFAAAAVDVLFPLVPAETIVIAASVIAAQGDLLVVLIIPAAVLGALLGDNIGYLVGRRVGKSTAKRIFRGEKGRSRLERAEQAIQKRGVGLIVAGRFIPGGRTASTLAAGSLRMSYRRFLLADAAAALSWAVYVSTLGYIGGNTFTDNFWLSLLVALGLAGLATVAIEGWRHVERRRGKDVFGEEIER